MYLHHNGSCGENTSLGALGYYAHAMRNSKQIVERQPHPRTARWSKQATN